MLVDIILGIIPLIIPYTILGENLSSIVLSIVGILYLIINKNRINVNKKIIVAIILLNFVAIISVIFVSPYIESISGFVIYFNILIYYIAYSKMLKDKNKEVILKYILIGASIVAIYYILVQGMYYRIRIYGNIGYANSYALLLLVAIYFNRIRRQDKFVDILEMIFMLGIFFTGSRTTLVLLILYLLFRIKQENEKSISNITNICEGIIWALIQYVIYSSMGISSLIVLPIIIAIYIGIKNTKVKKYIYLCLLLCSVVVIISGSNNTLKRVRNISINNGSFQERLVFYEDSIKAIVNEPFGHGINMFQYKSYEGASAFYDVKYIHNSVLQISYDIGILGGIIFLILIISGFILILKSKNNKMILALYISVFVHSLLDFDMSYSTFGILLVMLIAFSTRGEEQVSFNVKKVAVIPVCILLIYLGVFEGSIAIGKSLLVASNKVLTVANNISFDLDYRGYFNKAQGYKQLYDRDGSDVNLQESLDLLNKSIQINKEDPRIIWNTTYIYMKLDNEEKVLEYMDELLTKERYNKEVYSLYYDYFNEKKELKKEEKYSMILDTIKARHEDSLKKLNSKSVYMNNQLN